MIEYKLFTISEALNENCSDQVRGEITDVYDSDYRNGIFLVENGIITKVLGLDGGEPEDQTLGRDWGWVLGALEDAYQKGLNEHSGKN